MRPTINPNKFASTSRTAVLVNRLYDEPARGDIIIALSPDDRGRSIVKRIVGIDGDYIQHRKTKRIIRVPKGSVWVEGDNAENSRDSNDYGPLPVNLITGKATRILVSQEIKADGDWMSDIFKPLQAKDVSVRLADQNAFLDQEIADARRKNLIDDLVLRQELLERNPNAEELKKVLEIKHEEPKKFQETVVDVEITKEESKEVQETPLEAEAKKEKKEKKDKKKDKETEDNDAKKEKKKEEESVADADVKKEKKEKKEKKKDEETAEDHDAKKEKKKKDKETDEDHDAKKEKKHKDKETDDDHDAKKEKKKKEKETDEDHEAKKEKKDKKEKKKDRETVSEPEAKMEEPKKHEGAVVESDVRKRMAALLDDLKVKEKVKKEILRQLDEEDSRPHASHPSAPPSHPHQPFPSSTPSPPISDIY